MDNHLYDLIKVLAEKGEATEVYEKYMKDVADCEQCNPLMQRLKTQAEKDIEEMKAILASHAKTGAL